MPSKLGYWKLRGLAQSIRYLLEYTGEEYDEKIYEHNNEGSSDWFDVKFTLGLAFPNLPYYIDGDIKLTESTAILRYLGRKHGLEGQSAKQKAEVDLMLAVVYDLHMGFARKIYGNPQFEEKKTEYMKENKDKLKPVSEFLADKKFLVGDEVTLPDFHMYEVLFMWHAFNADSVAAYPNLMDYMKRFEALPKIKAYMESSRFISYPFSGKMAAWGGN